MSVRALLRACFGRSRNMHNDPFCVLTESAETYERVVVRLKVLKRGIGKLVAGEIVAAIYAGRDVVVEKNQMAGIAHGQRLKHHCVDQRENSRIGADAERERKHGNRYENRSFTQLTNAVAKVAPRGLEPVDGAGVSHSIPNQRDIAERTTGLGAVKLEFLAHLGFEVVWPEEIEKSTQHDDSQAKSRKLETAAVFRRQRST